MLVGDSKRIALLAAELVVHCEKRVEAMDDHAMTRAAMEPARMRAIFMQRTGNLAESDIR